MTAARPKLRVAVLMGGQSSEHDVSLASGLQVLSALDRERHEPLPIVIGLDGTWHVGLTPEEPTLRASSTGGAPRPTREAGPSTGTKAHGALDRLREDGAVDVVFVALHGPLGEDGTVQGLLELAGVPYTGSGVLASALAMDKVKAKEIYAQASLPLARHAVVHRRDLARVAQEATRVAEEVGLPCVVKPVAAGSSVATHRVRDAAELPGCLEDALAADERALVEELVEGTELTCGVLGGGPHEEAEALPLTEIVPHGGTFFDFESKYTPGACEEITPARVDRAVAEEVQRLALRAHEALGCEGMSRSDFIVRGGVPVVLETNTIPGMTRTSLLPQAAAAAGIPFPALVDRLVESALRRERGRRRS